MLIIVLGGFPGTVKGQSFSQLSSDILETIQSFYPVRSTAMGIHAYDHRFTDYSSKSVDRMVKKLTDFEKRLYRLKSASLSRHDQINYQLLKSNVDIALVDLKKIRWHRRSPYLYVDESINGIYYLILSNHAPLPERLVSILNRMRAVPDFLATARKNIRKPPQLYIEAATDMLEDAMRFYKDVAAELSNKFPERADELSAVSTRAREAMNDFMVYLSGLTPGPETDVGIGKDNFNYKLAHEYFLDFDSDSLLRLGEVLFEQAGEAYRQHVQYFENNHQNGTDSVFVPANFTKQDILDYYNWEARQEKLYLQSQEILTIPDQLADLVVIETPSFLRSLVGMYAYQPAGPFDSVQKAFFYVRPIPDDLDRAQLEARYRYVHRRGFKGPVVHEAYPGHHLQMQIGGLNTDPVRKWQRNLMMIEGWGLYCEQMMYEQGLYGKEDAGEWLNVLDGIRFRAARIIADVKLHTGQMNYRECVDWMVGALGITNESGRRFIETEIRRYALTPTQQMSYLIGKLEILSLLEAAKKRDGDAFSLRKFHDDLLAEGSIPPALMWEILSLQR